MKRIFWGGALRFGLLGWVGVWSGGVAWAQLAGSAQVSDVATATQARRFAVPQVKLPNAAAARRINQTLLRRFRGEVEDVDSTASPRQQLLQAARSCCYKEREGWYTYGGQGTTATRYEVLLNQNNLLSLQFHYDNQGFENPESSHLTFDLRTGRLLTLADLVADTPAQLNRRMAGAISRRLRDNLGEAVEIYGDDSDRIAYVASTLYQIKTWDTTPQRGLQLDTNFAPDASLAPEPYRYEFALRPDALLLYYAVGMSRAEFEFLPDEKYVFPWVRLHLRAPLLLLAHPQPRPKRP